MKKRFIIISGGELFNKGAQAMTFITINELRKRFPEKEIVVLSGGDYDRIPYEKRKYNFLIRPNRIYTKRLYDPFDIWSQQYLIKQKSTDDMINILENADFMVDISGYALSSQRGIDVSLEFLHRIYVARYYKIKVFLLPQSFGPFDYKEPYKKIMYLLLKTLLKYPVLVCAREYNGYSLLKKYCNKNLIKCDDIVWNNHSKIDLLNLYKNEIPSHSIQIMTKNNVAIVPNVRLIEYGEEEFDYISFYSGIINYLLKQKFNIYIVSHSDEDIELCKAIKGAFYNTSEVINVNVEINFWEYENFIKNMQFVIASRFHSVVHAYKQCVPVLVIGWSEKYKELVEITHQKKYIIDVRNGIVCEDVIDLLKVLQKNITYEKEKIKQAVEISKQKESIFEKIFYKLSYGGKSN